VVFHYFAGAHPRRYQPRGLDGHGARLGVAVAALAASILIHGGTNLQNDVGDFRRGADGAGRIGPPRATTEGWLPAAQVQFAAILCFTLAFVPGAYLVVQGGWPIVAIGLASVAAGAVYTAGPRPVAYSGWGEAFVILFFGLVAVGGMYYLHAGTTSATALLAGAALGLLAAAVLVVNNLRDIDSDRRIGKNTLAVRRGVRFTLLEYALLLHAPFALVLALAGHEAGPTAGTHGAPALGGPALAPRPARAGRHLAERGARFHGQARPRLRLPPQPRRRARLAPIPLPQFDGIAVRVADLGAGVVGTFHRSPGRRYALGIERRERSVHVLHLEGEALPAEALLAAARSDRLRRFGIAHHLDRRAAKLEIDEVERAGGRARDARAFALAETEDAGVEGHRALGRGGQELDVVDALEHG
jgi:1,4-dihydroxy-2-naphthoate octaprenyltransferase